jgi:sulfite exporter TauE/SafE/plastocyanin domain-containing protein/copper chaperone CopZ
MSGMLETAKIVVDGMSCSSCERRIESALERMTGVGKARASAPLAEVIVSFDPRLISLERIHDAIRGAGYSVREPSADTAIAPEGQPASRVKDPAAAKPDAAAKEPRGRSGKMSITQVLGLLAIIAALYFIIRYTVGFSFVPSVSQSMGYGLILLVGLLTSLHCIAMCGGINLSQTIAREEGAASPGATSGLPPQGPQAAPAAIFRTSRFFPSILYNGGRVISYTIVGAAAGALGSVFSLSSRLKGVMPIAAGAFMLFLGVRMLGVFPWLSRLRVRLLWGGRHGAATGHGAADGDPGGASCATHEKPQSASVALHRTRSSRSPFFVGLANGLMPCGPLQTMQVYALGTGSMLAGALSMFLFSLGTVPLMFGFGAVSSFLSARFNRGMLKASGVLVAVLGLVMFTRGMNLFGVGVTIPGRAGSSSVSVASIRNGVQNVSTRLDSGRYYPLVVQKGIPVRWTVTAKAEDLNGCNNPLTVPQYGIRKQLVPGDNLIEFTPEREGTITYTCWMGMISSTISVVSDLSKASTADPKQPGQGSIASAFPGGTGSGGLAGGCCGVTPPAFAGGKVPTDAIGIAQRDEEGQVVDVRVNDAGYTPAVLVLQRGLKAKIRFVPEKLSGCNSTVVFPEYQGQLSLAGGRLATPYLEISQDFTFQCGMGMLHGYVKVVDDITKVDLGEVRKTVAAYKPASRGGGGCCGN